MQHHAKKRFGQHFLHDRSVIARIVQAVAPQLDDHLVEIGPGLGAITLPLLERVQTLHAVELDRDVIPLLQEKTGTSSGRLVVHQSDALKFDFAALAAETGSPLRLVGNLPYNVSSPLLFHFLKFRSVVKDMHFMLQKEVVQRLCAAPGDSAYGRLGIMIQYHCEARYLFTVPPGAFSPPPKVESAIVRLTPRATIEYPADDPDKLALVVRTAFNQRRKTLRNNLKPLMPAEAIESLGLNPGERAENLGIREFVMLANHLSRMESTA